MKVILKEVGKDPAIVDVDYVYRNECGKLIEKGITNEYVDVIHHEFAMLVDEDGLMKQLPLNFCLEFKGHPYFPIQAIVGTVVFYRYKWQDPFLEELWDLKLEDVTEADLNMVREMLDKRKQYELKVRLFNRG